MKCQSHNSNSDDLAPESMLSVWYLDISQYCNVAAKKQIWSLYHLILSLVETHYNEFDEDQSLREKKSRCSKSMLMVSNTVCKMNL